MNSPLLLRFPSGKCRPTGGFTQLELVVVMVVLVILAGAAIPSLRGLETLRRDTTALRIRTVLIHAQTWSMDHGANTWVEFDLTRKRVQAFTDSADPPPIGSVSAVAGEFTVAAAVDTVDGAYRRPPLRDPLTGGPLRLRFRAGSAGIESIDLGAGNDVMFDPDGIPHDGQGNRLTRDGIVVVEGGRLVRITKNTGLIRIE